LTGSAYADVLSGNGSANQIDGAGGNDVINGGGGNDTLFGGAGNDRLVGGVGNTVLTGGTGSDTFAFGATWGQALGHAVASDTITDFTHKQDKIEFSGVAGLTNFGQLAITQTGADAHVSFGGHEIILAGVAASTVTASDFLFV
jgi:Ca2+-binding RTX toxin-like protein